MTFSTHENGLIIYKKSCISSKVSRSIGTIVGTATTAGRAIDTGTIAKNLQNLNIPRANVPMPTRQFDNVASTASTVGRRTDDVTDASSLVGRRTGDVTDSASFVGRRADDVADTATTAGKKSGIFKKSAQFCRKNPKSCVAGAVAVTAGPWLLQDHLENDERIKECSMLCLPTNWNDVRIAFSSRKVIPQVGKRPVTRRRRLQYRYVP